MKQHHRLPHALILASVLVLLASCSDGGDGPSTPPEANSDTASLIQNTPITLDLLANDTDAESNIDNQSIVLVTPPSGTVEIGTGFVTYTPPEDFVGTDSFDYQVRDLAGNLSNVASVTITVAPITITTLNINPLAIPSEGYALSHNNEFGGTQLTSPGQPLAIPPNTISLALTLRGTSAGTGDGDLFFSDLFMGSSLLRPLFRQVAICYPGYCTAYLPRSPDQLIASGDAEYVLSTFATSLADVDFTDLQLHLTTRVGPKPDLVAAFPATLNVQPWLTATTVDAAQLQTALDELVTLAAVNNLKLNLKPITTIADARFNEVAGDFADPDTAALVEMGTAQDVNVFFIESFSGTASAGYAGLAPGVPGSLGIRSDFNGVLVKASTSHADYARIISEVTLHEIGHLLGLYHTTESDFARHDVLDDTYNCTQSEDANDDGKANNDECADGSNVMFWNLSTAIKDPLTDDQKYVLFHSPLAVP